MEELLKNQKKISFSGAGASHKNGAEDRAIKILVTMEIIMLMHAALRSTKDTFSTYLFPMKIYYAVCIYSQIPVI